MASDFDIGPSGGLAIFTNDSEDMFNSGNFDEPSFQIDSGHTQGIADIGDTTNVAGGISVDFTNSEPVSFQTPMQPPPVQSGTTSLNNLGVDTGFSKPPPRQKAESISSDKTVEAEPVERGFRPHKPVKPKRTKRTTSSDPVPTPPEPIVFNQTNVPTPKPAVEIGADSKEINFGFDELLDTSKLKPLKEDIAPAAHPMPEPVILPEPTSPVDSFSVPPSGFDYPSSPPAPPSPFTAPTPNVPEPTYSFKDIPKYANEDEEKLDLLLKLKNLEQNKGVTLSKHFGAKSNLEDIRIEYKHQTGMIERASSVKMMKNGLIFVTSGIEYMNRRFDPIGAKLDGWGESVMENSMDYDGIFERLHEKYQGSVEMEPEMELLVALAGSAFMFHLSGTLFKSAVPQFDNVLRERPGLVQEIFGAATEAARRQQTTSQAQQQFAQTGPLPANAVQGGPGVPQQPIPGMPQRQMQPPPMDLGSILGSVMGGLGGLGGGFPGMPGGGMTGMATDPMPRAVDTQNIPDPPMNEIYRQMVQRDQDALSVTSHTSDLGKGATITESPKGDRVIRI